MSVFSDGFLVTFQALMTLLLISAFGWIGVRQKLVSDQGVEGMTRVLVDVVVPAKMMIIVAGYLNAETLKICAQLISVMYGVSFLGYGFAWLVVKIWRGTGITRETNNAIMALCMMQNSFFLALPLAMAICPPEHLSLMALLTTSAYVVLLSLQWTVGVILLSSVEAAKPTFFQQIKPLFNLPLAGILLGAVFSQIPIFAAAARGEEAPLLVLIPMNAARTLGDALSPVAMLTLGMMIAQCELGKALRVRTVLITIAFRFFVSPVVILGLIHLFGWATTAPVLALALMIQAAMPPATASPIVARRYGGDWQSMSATLLVMYSGALLAVPFWLSFLKVNF
ncbi:MAG: AEC family transporter [Candidatus Sumerlaeia bacterium]|nr:AEC family transporter [Candidatus Sumerlaeia bacterium]